MYDKDIFGTKGKLQKIYKRYTHRRIKNPDKYPRWTICDNS